MEGYLAGFGVLLNGDPDALFSPSCPYCGEVTIIPSR